tara:strand:+ start:2851 stop:3036 length:186 start_codon:yes stop_codon:yes gene_type:complete
MEDRTYLSIAYIGMIIGIGIWTWTVVSRNRRLASRITAMERTLKVKHDETEATVSLNEDVK